MTSRASRSRLMRDFVDFAVRFPIINTVPVGIGASRFGRLLLGHLNGLLHCGVRG